MKTTMYMNQFTQIDHSYIDSKGCIVGGSYNLSCTVSGQVDTNEQVVIDFSACKKKIKELIDCPVNGYDHKCWIINNVSNYHTYTGNELLTPALYVKSSTSDCFKFIPNTSKHGYFHAAAKDIQNYLNYELGKIYPGIVIVVYLDEVFHINRAMLQDKVLNEVRYVHGLRNSSSYGCQNIAHGHLSYYSGPKLEHDYYVFAHKHNVSTPPQDSYLVNSVVISYTSERGTMYMEVDTTKHNVVVFDNETTIENLANSEDFAGFDYVSEGLAKGAFRTL